MSQFKTLTEDKAIPSEIRLRISGVCGIHKEEDKKDICARGFYEGLVYTKEKIKIK